MLAMKPTRYKQFSEKDFHENIFDFPEYSHRNNRLARRLEREDIKAQLQVTQLK
jgi:hypothetical protein